MSSEKLPFYAKVQNKFCYEAVFSDETANYREPWMPTHLEEVKITLRTGKDTVSGAFLCTMEEIFPMQLAFSAGIFDYFQVTLPPAAETMYYYFRLIGREDVLYYTRQGAFENYQREGWFQIIRNYAPPAWAQGAVMYQIYPDRFCNGDPTNDVLTNEYMYLGKPTKQISDWSALPEQEDIRNFYGGDLQGIMNKLDYLEDLGVDALYLNPIFLSPSNHKYDIQDYEHIDPHLGVIEEDDGALLFGSETNTEATRYIQRITSSANLKKSDLLFAALVKKAHEKGIRVIIDGVFNHCGAFHKWLDREGIYEYEHKGAFHHTDSPYRPYFYWTGEHTYEGWWGHDNHPKLNMQGCPALEKKIFEIGKKWVSPPFCADGWRLDVAADLGKTAAYNHSFWQGFRRSVKQANADAVILAEHYGDPAPWLNGSEWDSIMNYDAFMEPVTWFFTGVSKHSTEYREDLYNNGQAFWETMSYQMARLPIQAIVTAMNQISNHDHSRFLTRTNGRLGRLNTEGSLAAGQGVQTAVLREAVLLQMTWPGAPTIYYGDEAGLCGWTDPDNRRTYPWGRENQNLIAFHRECIRFRRQNPALRSGSMKQLHAEMGVIGYGRFTEENRCVILFNNLDEAQEVAVPVWQIGMAKDGIAEMLLETQADGFILGGGKIAVKQGVLRLKLTPKSGVLLREVVL